MEQDIKILENMRDNIYGAIQFEDDYQVRITERKEFDALNLAINHLRKTKLVYSQFIPKSKLKEKIEELEEQLKYNLFKNHEIYTVVENKLLHKIEVLQELLKGE
jgi:hypothetical protein